MSISRTAFLFALIGTLYGCGGADLNLAPVSGTITVDGIPLAGVSVQFQPQKADSNGMAPTSFGVTDDDGHYSLEVTTTGQQGTLVGPNQVTFSLPEVGGDSDVAGGESDQASTGNFNDERVLDVPSGGTDSANFDLTTG